ncbi:MAG: TrmH family RNA methyltransferase [Breznakibacter sp.]
MVYNAVRFFGAHHVPPVGEGCELILVAWRFKTPENIGGVMRLAGNLGVKKVVAVESHIGNVSWDKLKRVARTAFAHTEMERVPEADVLQVIPHGHVKVALETAQNSQNIFKAALPSKMVLFLGNEQAGLPVYLVEQCDLCVHIPLTGNVKSMNVAQAATVAAFEWYRQHSGV